MSLRHQLVLISLLAATACSSVDEGGAGEVPSTTDRSSTAATSVAPVDTSSAPDVVAPTEAPPATVESASTTSAAPPLVNPTAFTEVDRIVEAFVDERALSGASLIVVHRDAGVLYRQEWGGFLPDRVSLIASSGKVLSAGILLYLADQGLLDLDAPVVDVVEWGAAHPDITPAQLVSNSSGLVGLLPDPSYLPYVCQFDPSTTLQSCAEQVFTTPGDDGDVVAPDTEFRYGGGQWQVAGAVAEAASGRSWAELVDEVYVRPCGLGTLGFNNHFTQLESAPFQYPPSFDGAPPTGLAPTANPHIGGGSYTTPDDYASLLLMQLRGGRCGDEQVLSQRALDIMHADRIGEVYGGDAVGDDTGYGFGWWVDRAAGRLRDPGAYGAVAWLDLADGYGAFQVIEADAATGAELAGQLYDVVDAAVAAAS